jgi:hypothetical protein
MSLLQRFADPALQSENLELRLQRADDQQTIRLQADKIKQLTALIAADERLSNRLNNIRPCLCGYERWKYWGDGARAGKDGVVSTADDNLIPDRSR